MTFNSLQFVVFLAVVLIVYWRVPTWLRNTVLLVASYIFYGWWDWRFLGLLALSTVVDFVIGQRIFWERHPQRRKRLLITSVSFNIGILAIFKYFDFFTESAADALNSLGFEANPVALEIILPVGISFYTFQTISYSFDIYRKRIDPTHSIIDFATYVSYFPQLVAGPIERAQRLLPQISNYERAAPGAEGRAAAMQLILFGLFKKVVLADGVARIANEAFDNASNASWLLLIAGVVAFAIQIYGDFSGYTDIARGVSLLFGIDLIVNFTEPYLSRNITEFWRRWHISLSDWLRDYLYIPLGGNRGSSIATYRNLMITMLLGGLWHGASWNFVIWGGLHGLYLVVHKMLRGGTVPDAFLHWNQIGTIVLTNIFVLIAWVFFRSADVPSALDVLGGIAALQTGFVEVIDIVTVTFFAIVTLALDLLQRWSRNRAVPILGTSTDPVRYGAITGSLCVAVLLFAGGTPVPFIYFQF